MGLEADSQLMLDGESTPVRALLESHELILRGGVRRKLPIAELDDVHVAGDQLLFSHDQADYALTLPPSQATKWLKKIITPPPSLAHKLSLDAAHPALVYGAPEDAAVTEALAAATTTDPLAATQTVIIAENPQALAAALAEAIRHALPVWVIFPKGAASPLPESEVRQHLRALNYVDTKTSAVSDRLTALKFSRRQV